MKRVIYGGSFDPITKAHLGVIEKLAQRFDEVIVVPAFISPFKAGQMSLSGEQRLDLIYSETATIKGVTVSNCELLSPETSYSYLTVERFYSEQDELYFAVGSDGLKTLTEWKNPQVLASKCTFYLIERPYYEIDQADLARAREVYRVELADFIGEVGSSSLLKVAVAFNKADEVVSENVARFITERNLYSNYRYITDRYDEFKVKQSRREHIYRTAKCAIILASKAGVSIEKTVKAVLYHDIAKYLTETDLLNLGVKLTPKAKSLPASCTHQETGADLAKVVFGETDDEILMAVRTHTTGAENMSTYQKIVYCADYIENGRNFDGVEKIRKSVYRDLNEGTLAVMENTIKYLNATGKECSPETVKAYEYLKKEMKK